VCCVTVTAEGTPDTAVDPALLHLLNAAESGNDCPVIYLLAGGWLIQGTPVASRVLLVDTQNYFYEQISQSREARKFRGSPAEKDAVIRAAVASNVTPIGQLEPGVSAVFTLASASAYPPGAPMIHMRVVRVPLTTIVAWWITGFAADNSP